MESKRVGVIGGGQLAWMMGAEAPSLNVKLIVQTPSQNDPAVGRSHALVLADVDDAQATEQLAQMCDLITFENEFVNLVALQKLAQQGVCFRPSLDVLAPLLDKYDQRNYLQSIPVAVPKFSLWSSEAEIMAQFNFPLVLKARRHGYDGQGTFIVKNQQELENLSKTIPVAELLVEEFIPFERELGIMAARSTSGEIAIYPVTETYQQNQVCHWTITPADVPEKVAAAVTAIARTILEKLEVVGIFGIEFFLTSDHRLLVNEIAPRTHNSGHYTLDGCHTSQFAMQLQAVTGIALGSTALKSAGALMVNLLGLPREEYAENSTLVNQVEEEFEAEYLEKRNRLLQIPHSFVHWYGKVSRPGRKLGHVTVVLNTDELSQARSIIRQIESIWYTNQNDFTN